jgi:hypothetical protein
MSFWLSVKILWIKEIVIDKNNTFDSGVIAFQPLSTKLTNNSKKVFVLFGIWVGYYGVSCEKPNSHVLARRLYSPSKDEAMMPCLAGTHLLAFIPL